MDFKQYLALPPELLAFDRAHIYGASVLILIFWEVDQSKHLVAINPRSLFASKDND